MADEQPAKDTRCPTCGAPAERGQLVCLECGGRIALDYRRPYGWKLPVALVTGVVLLVGAGSAIALQAVDDESGKEAAKAVGTVPKTTTAKKKEKPTAQAAPEKKNKKTPARQTRAAAGWPQGQSGFTVVIGSTEDRRSAAAFAREARTIGVPAGVLESDRHAGLGRGLWIVYAGVFEERARAERAVTRFAKRYPGAYPQAVRPR